MLVRIIEKSAKFSLDRREKTSNPRENYIMDGKYSVITMRFLLAAGLPCRAPKHRPGFIAVSTTRRIRRTWSRYITSKSLAYCMPIREFR